MIGKNWPKNILSNFDYASNQYNQFASLQKGIAKELADQCSQQFLPEGTWVDLGSGTGFLADYIENLNPSKNVIRIDGSMNMLDQQKQVKFKQVWDLNKGLPTLTNPVTLLASSFALHWLENPKERVREWYSALANGGYLALAVPISCSFPEWERAALNSNVNFTAMSLPSSEELIACLPSKNIKIEKIKKITQYELHASKLLKPIVKAGAHATNQPSLTVGELRRLINSWALPTKHRYFELTWFIQILLAKK